ncbi:LysR family transcriptional regulator [Nitrincola tibetensis]|uniref:LysR family transcriptional regulator n=1 Tax=Nitrincola tibetensis TaxID=2219697 RepID=A0A364NMI6_9GAMM|nr:LysR substrate-binding domain-containing protein [Nitrincola tibetensis]RAU18318.1 LysR family transcriptional regulator [Nitrincola tibetensis]
MNRWDCIDAFVEVVKLGSFSAAAKHLKVSGSHVSRLVARLEEQLGTQLLYRTTRHIRLTDAGQVYFEHCRHMLDGFLEAEAAINDLQSSPKGILRLTAGTTFGEHFIAPIVNDFMLKYPLLEVRMHFTNRCVELVEEGYDVAIRMGVLDDSSLIARRILDRNERLVASPEYLQHHATPECLQDLYQHQCLVGTKDRWLFSVDGQRREIRISGRYHANSGLALVDAALKGMGITQLPGYYIDEYIETGRLVPVLDEYRFRESAVWIMYPHHRYLSPKVRLFIDFLVERTQQPDILRLFAQV